MGIFSFLFGGKKSNDKAAPKPAAEKPAKVEERNARCPETAEAAPCRNFAGRLAGKTPSKARRVAAHRQPYGRLRSARALADIQLRAGRKTVARVWQKQADQLKAELSA